ncbi:hypothetical protein [Nocardia sp. CA-120079]|uniref:hypothetical protein n=1 Tax=Nocardia sp. CA-120079 TaxID=3239974 RepID=UPI003D987FD5
MCPSASSTEAPQPFPDIEPYEVGLLDVGDGNQVYWETSGNSHGKPALVVHGGPGSGGRRGSAKLFDPNVYPGEWSDDRMQFGGGRG